MQNQTNILSIVLCNHFSVFSAFKSLICKKIILYLSLTTLELVFVETGKKVSGLVT